MYENTLVIKSVVHCLQRWKIYYAELSGRMCKRTCVGRVGSCDIFRLAIKILILKHYYSTCNAFCVSDLLSDRERQKTAVYLRISNPAKIYRSREDVDESTSLSILPDTHHPV